MKENQTNQQDEANELTLEESKELWNKISTQIQVKEREKKIKQLGRIASLAVILGVVGIMGYNQLIRPEVYVTESGPLDLKLKDGTVVRLLKGGKLTIEKSIFEKSREVHLEGNALFRVTKSKDHPFIVHGAGYDTQVLGTSFKVIQDKGTFKVDLYEGKVAVHPNSNTGETYSLSPNESFTNYGNRKVAAILPLIRKEVSGKAAQNERNLTGPITLEFKDCPLGDAVRVIEEVYDVNVEFPEEYKDRLVSTGLKESSADTVLQSLALLMRLNLQQQHDSTYQLEK